MKRHDLTRDLETLCARAGQGTQDGAPLVAPIVQSTTYVREGIGSDPLHTYSRDSNPTVAALESALGALENAPPAVAFATGLAAETALFVTLLAAGDHVVASRALYGGTTRLLEQVLAGLGVQSTFVDTTDVAAVEAALRPTTRVLFVETPANPTLDVSDLSALAHVAHRGQALLVVDNTFLTPVLQRPLDLGADLTVSSTTKFVEGHSVALGGAVVGRDPDLLQRLRFVRKCTGGIQAPFNAWLTLQGLRTLPLRLERQSSTAAELAVWLARHPATRRVHYPSLAAPEQRAVAESQHLGAHGAVLSFELEGGYEAACSALERFQLCRLVEHVGSVETLVTHSASMTHAGVSPEQRARTGVSDGLLRISVGLEHPAAIREDLERALGAASPRAQTPKGGTPCSSAN